MSYFTLKDGQKLYYEDRGQGEDTLVMMHGRTSSTATATALRSSTRAL